MGVRITLPEDFNRLQELYAQLFVFELDNCDPYMDVDFPFYHDGVQYLGDVANNTVGRAGFVYEDEQGDILGYASLRTLPKHEYSHRKNIKPIQLQTLIVDEKYRGQGIGKSLIEACIKLAKQNACTHIRVSAMAKNTAARDLYKKCGFHEQEIMHEMAI